MLNIVLSLLAGAAAGFVLRKRALVHRVFETATTLVVFLLLFMLGLMLGGDRKVLGRLGTVGVQAALLALGGVAGSVLVSAPVYRRFFQGDSVDAQEPVPRDPDAPPKNASRRNAQRKNTPRRGPSHSAETSFISVGVFAGGILVGLVPGFPRGIVNPAAIERLILLLVFLVGVGTGSNARIWAMLGRVHVRVVLVPLSCVAGTLLGAGAVSLVLPGLGLLQALAVGSGFGYYSLSSVIISGIAGSTLGTVALISNLLREVMTLIGAPLFAALFGRLAPIAAGGATSMDVTLPVITGTSGKEYAVIALFNGMVLTLLVPLLVPVFL